LNHNLVNAVDLHFLRSHWERWPYAPEGWGTILSTIPTISTTLLGLLIGELLMSSRSKQTKAKMLGGLGILSLALGYALSPIVPVIMKMWTTSYGLVSAGWACLMLLVFYWIVDLRGYRKWTLAFVVIGMNPIFIYMATSILPIRQRVEIFTRVIAGHMGAAGPPFNSLAVLALEWLLLFWMYKRKIFIKA
jgi:predicted acyltransferase